MEQDANRKDFEERVSKYPIYKHWNGDATTESLTGDDIMYEPFTVYALGIRVGNVSVKRQAHTSRAFIDAVGIKEVERLSYKVFIDGLAESDEFIKLLDEAEKEAK